MTSEHKVELVSVVIPMWNAATTIGHQLWALSQQDYEGRWEILVVDNGSTDNSADVVQQWLKRLPMLRLLSANQRQGPGYARRVGSEATKGDVILYCDADDMVMPGWVSAMVRGLRTADVVGSVFDVTTIADMDTLPSDLRAVVPVLQPFPQPSFLPWAGSCGAGIRSDVLRSLGSWRVDLTVGEDVDLSWRAQLAGYTLSFVSDAVVLWRPPPGPRGLMRRNFRFATHAPRMYKDFRSAGARRRPLRDVAHSLASLVLTAPLALVSASRRESWLNQFAIQAGRVVGSIKHRTLYI